MRLALLIKSETGEFLVLRLTQMTGGGLGVFKQSDQDRGMVVGELCKICPKVRVWKIIKKLLWPN